MPGKTDPGDSILGQTGCENIGVYSIPLQINYEDTDAGGVVYYGNYLAYMERTRNAYLRECGFPLRALSTEHGVLFVVTEAALKYLLPARLDDELRITLKIVKTGATEIIFEHLVMRGEECLVKGEIKLATLNSKTFQPRRIPDFLRVHLSISEPAVEK